MEFIDGGQSLEPVPSIGMVEHLLAQHRQHRQCHGHGRHDGAAHLVRRAAGDAGDPRAADGREPPGPSTLQAQAPAAADQTTGARIAAGEGQPNLIADLTSKRGRTPQKRLEQMADFDEEQAAAILKQWMHGAKSA